MIVEDTVVWVGILVCAIVFTIWAFDAPEVGTYFVKARTVEDTVEVEGQLRFGRYLRYEAVFMFHLLAAGFWIALGVLSSGLNNCDLIFNSCFTSINESATTATVTTQPYSIVLALLFISLGGIFIVLTLINGVALYRNIPDVYTIRRKAPNLARPSGEVLDS